MLTAQPVTAALPVRPSLNGHRMLEITALAAIFTLCSCLAWRLCECLTFGDSAHDPQLEKRHWLWAGIGAPLGIIVADFCSGFVHWMADRFGTDRTPYWGPHFVRPFREHHTNPKDITHHDFIETNGNNAILLFPVLTTFVLLLSNQGATPAHVMGLSFALAFSMFGFATNQVHKWAHADKRPVWVRVLQRTGFILSPHHHDIHHTAPYDTHYCITTGWLNKVLHHTRFFPSMEWLAAKTLGLKAAEGGEDAHRLALHREDTYPIQH